MATTFQGLISSLPDPKNKDGWRAVLTPLWECLEACRTKDTANPTFTSNDVEGAILKICTVGPPPLIRHLLRQLIHAYYSHPHYSAHNLMRGLSKVLNDKNNIPSRVSCIECQGQVMLTKGFEMGSTFQGCVEDMNKSFRSGDLIVRLAAISCLAELAEGAGISGRFVHAEMLKVLKSAATDRNPAIQEVAIQALRSLALHCTEDLSSLVEISAKEATKPLTVHGFVLHKIHSILSSNAGSLARGEENDKAITDYKTVAGVIQYLIRLWRSRAATKEGRDQVTRCVLTFLEECTLHKIFVNLTAFLDLALSFVSKGNSKILQSKTDWLHAASCSVQIMSSGIEYVIGSVGRATLIEKIEEKLAVKPTTPYESIVLLRVLSWFVLRQGDGAVSTWSTFVRAIIPHAHTGDDEVTLWAATAIRATAETHPYWAVSLLGHFSKRLVKALGNDLVSRGEGLIVVSLLGALKEKPWLIPGPLFANIFDSAQKLITVSSNSNPNTTTTASGLASGVGWELLSALMVAGPTMVQYHLDQLRSLWTQTLAGKVLPQTAEEISSLFYARVCGCSVLDSFIKYCGQLFDQTILDEIGPMLQDNINCLNLFMKSPHSQSPRCLALSHRLTTIILSIVSSLPSVVHIPGTKILSLLISRAIASNTVSTHVLPSILTEDDDTLEDTSTTFAVEDSITCHYENLWRMDLRELVQDVSGWHQDPQRVLLDVGIKGFSHLVEGANSHKKLVEVIKFLLDSFKAAEEMQERLSIQTNTTCALLAFLKYQQAEVMRHKEKDLSILSPLFTSIMSYAESGLSHSDSNIRRACAEIVGLTTALQNELAPANNYIRVTLKQMTARLRSNENMTTKGACALAMACVHRCVGSVKSRGVIKETVKTLLSLLQAPPQLDSSHSWLLHSLCVVMETGFSPATAKVITTAVIDLLFKEGDPETREKLFPIIGRFLNLLLRSGAPQSQPDVMSLVHISIDCISRSRNWQVHLQKVSIHETQLLFDPTSSNCESILDLLQNHLSSPLLPVRTAVVAAVQLIGQHNAQLLFSKLNKKLFVILDKETDANLAATVRSLILSIIDVVSETNPVSLLSMLNKVVLGDTDTNTSTNETAEAEATESGEANITWSPSESTKQFAMSCVREVIKAVKPVPQHLDLVKAREDKSGTEWLVLSHPLISNIFLRTCSSHLVSLKGEALLLADLMQKVFGDSEDPDFEGHYLNEVMEAQVGLSLRAALKNTEYPFLQAQAAGVIPGMIHWSFTHNEEARAASSSKNNLSVMFETLKTLGEVGDRQRLETEGAETEKNESYASYSRIMVWLVETRLLLAFAKLYTLPPDSMATVITDYLPLLKKQWTTYLRDCAILFSQSPTVMCSYSARYFDDYVSYNDTLYEELFGNWFTILEARSKIPATNTENITPVEEEEEKRDWYTLVGLTMYALSSFATSQGRDTTDNNNNSKNKNNNNNNNNNNKSRVPRILPVAAIHSLNSSDGCCYMGALNALSGFLKNPKLREYADKELVKDILSSLKTLNHDPCTQIRYMALSIFVQTVTTLTDQFFVDAPELVSIIQNVLEYEMSIGQEGDEETMAMNMLSSLIPIIPTQPGFKARSLLWLFKKLETDSSPAMLQVRVNTLSCILNGEDDAFLYSSIGSILNSVEESTALTQSQLFAVLTALSLLKHTSLELDNNILALHKSCIRHFSHALTSPSVRTVTLTLLQKIIREFLENKTNTNSVSIGSTYVHSLVPSLIGHLTTSGGQEQPLSAQDLQFFAESIKFLLILHALTPNGGFLHVLLPTLVSLLNVQGQGSLHTTALNLILQFASSNATEVGKVVEALPLEKKQLLQYAIQLNAQREQEAEQQRANARAGKGKLTLDASKFG
eukprot:TRINITY_DN3841_c0_g1_i2.p1 TRINITY_DN3841_c0_g1~~TRINITY_DN3841_c0_g1_i2.p1  ORF type:complete len:1869 (+),score=310.07 TRINITY_DN3841_c0_g1_i2:6-5612(+)